MIDHPFYQVAPDAADSAAIVMAQSVTAPALRSSNNCVSESRSMTHVLLTMQNISTETVPGRRV